MHQPLSDTTVDLTLTVAAPTARLLSLDLIRGVAILGILLLNIYAFAMPPEAAMVLN